MGQEKNACIEMLDTRYIEPLRTKVAAARAELEQFPERDRTANQKVVADYAPVLEAYDRMKTAARAANPVFEKLLQRRREGGGLTREEIGTVISYIYLRSKPTLREIAATTLQQLWAEHLAPAQITAENQGDELSPHQPAKAHDHLLDQSIDALFFLVEEAQKQLPAAQPGDIRSCALRDAEDFTRARLCLEYADAHEGKLPETPKALRDYLRAKHHVSLIRDVPRSDGRLTLNHSVGEMSEHDLQRIRGLLSGLPGDCHHYWQRIKALSREEANNPDDIRNQAAPALRLAIRESSSAESDGITGILGYLVTMYEGSAKNTPWLQRILYQHDKIAAHYTNAHIGADGGVEDEHRDGANRIADLYLSDMFEHDPQRLAALFDEEAETIRVRTRLAQGCADAMDRVREQHPESPVIPMMTVQKSAVHIEYPDKAPPPSLGLPVAWQNAVTRIRAQEAVAKKTRAFH